jgi:putative transposase
MLPPAPSRTRRSRYGYRKIAELLRRAGWLVNVKRVEADLATRGLKVPARQPKRARLWLADGSCVRLVPSAPTTSGPTTFSRSAPMRAQNPPAQHHRRIPPRMPGHSSIPSFKSIDVIDALSDPFILRGVPEHIRSDNGPEFLAKVEW